jgi:hypothetical protein
MVPQVMMMILENFQIEVVLMLIQVFQMMLQKKSGLMIMMMYLKVLLMKYLLMLVFQKWCLMMLVFLVRLEKMEVLLKKPLKMKMSLM